ncbi:hypothetical protein CPB85DRAFT_1439215 [Mucidula mucida]|nr:hypothetical protein CPB85DRAFT_1439215 [Mucidula mucida]
MAPTFLTPAHPGSHVVKNSLVAAALVLAAIFIFVLVRFLGQMRALWSTTQAERDEMSFVLRRLARLLGFIAGHTNAPGAVIDPLSMSQGVAWSSSESVVTFPSPVRYFVRFYVIRGERSTDRSFV